MASDAGYAVLLLAEMMTVYDYNEVVERDKLCNTRQLSLRGCGARKGALLGRVLYCVQDILGLAKEPLPLELDELSVCHCRSQPWTYPLL
jgi:hypothetical protein